jgi:cytoskeletal protein CcmA (bactofilin family)
MAQARTSRANSGDASTIGSGVRIVGRVTGDGDVVIAGHVEGDILVRGDVTIAEGASCTSHVEGNEIVVAGTLSGDVSANGNVVIGSTARLRGNVSAKNGSISLEDGAAFAGKIECDFELPAGLGDAPSASYGGGARRR